MKHFDSKSADLVSRPIPDLWVQQYLGLSNNSFLRLINQEYLRKTSVIQKETSKGIRMRPAFSLMDVIEFGVYRDILLITGECIEMENVLTTSQNAIWAFSQLVEKHNNRRLPMRAFVKGFEKLFQPETFESMVLSEKERMLRRRAPFHQTMTKKWENPYFVMGLVIQNWQKFHACDKISRRLKQPISVRDISDFL